MSLNELHYKSLADRRKKQADLFERKFIHYRNKLKKLHDDAEPGSPLREEIRSFLEDEQGDVRFNDCVSNRNHSS